MTRKLVRICVISKHGSPSNHSHGKAIYRSISQVHTRKYPLNNFLIDQPAARFLFSGHNFRNESPAKRFPAHYNFLHQTIYSSYNPILKAIHFSTTKNHSYDSSPSSGACQAPEIPPNLLGKSV
jgi:hypothetical protein